MVQLIWPSLIPLLMLQNIMPSRLRYWYSQSNCPSRLRCWSCYRFPSLVTPLMVLKISPSPTTPLMLPNMLWQILEFKLTFLIFIGTPLMLFFCLFAHGRQHKYKEICLIVTYFLLIYISSFFLLFFFIYYTVSMLQ